jgi:hypothetical protein
MVAMVEKEQQHIEVLSSLMRTHSMAEDGNDAIHLNGKIYGYMQALNVMFGNVDAIEIEREAMAKAGCETPF